MKHTSMLDTVVKAPLKGAVQATVKSFQEVQNDKGGYVEVVFTLPDREYTLNIFPGTGATVGKQINYITSAIRKQLQIDGEVTLKDMLTAAKEMPITLYFSYSNEYNRMNVNFHEPVEIGSIDLSEIDA